MDLNNIEDIYNWYNIFNDINILPFFIIILLILLYKILSYSLSYMDNVEKIETKNIINQNNKINILLKELRILKKEIKKLNKSDFYNKLNLLFRDYFTILGFKKASKMSLKELSKTNIKNKSIFKIYKNSYYFEFNNLQDSFSLRKELIEKFIYTIKND